MSLPKLESRFVSGPVCEAPEELICREPVFSSEASPVALDSYVSKPGNSSSTSSAKDFAPIAFFTTAGFLLGGGVGAGAGFLLGLTACSNDEAPIDDAPSSNPTITPPTDHPPIQTGGANGGIGGGIQAMFASSECQNPVDLDISSVANGLLMTCGDDNGAGDKPGTGLIEKLDATSGAVSKWQLPTTLDGDSNKPIRLSSLTTGPHGAVYSGFSAVGSTAQFEGDRLRFSNSGIFMGHETGTGTVAAVRFAPLQLRGTVGSTVAERPINLASPNGIATAYSLRLNNPIALASLGERVFALLDPSALSVQDGQVGIYSAPAGLCRYTMNRFSGELEPEALPAETQQAVIAGTSHPHNCMVIDGYFYPVAMAPVGDEHIAVLIKGLTGMNPSGIHIFHAEDLNSGLEEGPDSVGGSFISFADAPDSANPDSDFVANSSNQLTIVRNRYALVGSADSSGRIAVVDCDHSPLPIGQSRVSYLRIFEEAGAKIAGIVTSPDEKFAYVLSNTGKIRALTLNEGAGSTDFGKLGDIFELKSLDPNSPIVTALAANAVIAASPGAYSKAPIQ